MPHVHFLKYRNSYSTLHFPFETTPLQYWARKNPPKPAFSSPAAVEHPKRTTLKLFSYFPDDEHHLISNSSNLLLQKRLIQENIDKTGGHYVNLNIFNILREKNRKKEIPSQQNPTSAPWPLFSQPLHWAESSLPLPSASKSVDFVYQELF